MSKRFCGGYGSIRGQSGGKQDERRSSGIYLPEDDIIFQSLSDTISRNILQINGNVQALERIIKQLGNQLKEVPYDKLRCIKQATDKLTSDTTVCLNRIISLQRGRVSERESSTNNKFPTKSPKNSFLFSSPEQKPRPLSIKETLESADDENFCSMDENFRKLLLCGQKTPNDFKAKWIHSLKQSIKTNSSFTSSPLTLLGDWNCPSCMVTNKAADKNCSQCHAKNNAPAEALGRHSSDTMDTTQANDLTQRFSSSWECTSCKCVACATQSSTKKAGNVGKGKQEIKMKVKFGAPRDTWECETYLIRNKNNLNKSSRPGESSNDCLKMKFGAPSGSWGCPTCMIQNKATDSKCVACEMSKPRASSNDDLKLKFAAPSGSWECPTCMIQNKAMDSKSVACATSKPGARSNEDFKLKFAAPSGSWECPTCTIQNKATDSKSVACATSKPGARSNEDFKLKFAAPSGSWECPTCTIQNKATDSKCVACATSKPGARSNEDFKLKFAAPCASWRLNESSFTLKCECPTCMIQNKATDSKCVACATSKPGAENGGSAPGLFPAGTSGIPGGNAGGFNVTGGGGMSSLFSFSNASTPSGGFNFGPTIGPTNPSNTTGMFNFGGATTNPALKPQSIGGQNSEQPALFNMGAFQTPPSNRIIKKAVRRTRR